MLRFMLYYLIAVNFVLLAVMAWDKSAAKGGRDRVRESTLLSLAVIGGSLGGILGMLAFRHKTRKPAFSVGLPAILLCHAVIAYLVYLKK